jgi:hypothetical protein
VVAPFLPPVSAAAEVEVTGVESKGCLEISVILGVLRAPTPPHIVALRITAASGTLSNRRCDARQPDDGEGKREKESRREVEEEKRRKVRKLILN